MDEEIEDVKRIRKSLKEESLGMAAKQRIADLCDAYDHAIECVRELNRTLLQLRDAGERDE